MKRKIKVLAFAMFLTAGFSYSANAFIKVCAANNDRKCGYTNEDGSKVNATGIYAEGTLKEVAEFIKEFIE